MNEWHTYTLEEACENIYSGGTPSTKNKEYWGGSLKWLSSGETSQRFIYDTERKITQLGVENSSTKFAYRGSTVVATAGQGHTRGQASFLMTDTYLNQSVIACKPNINIVIPLYLYYNLANRYEEFRLLSDGTSTRGSLSGRILKKMAIRLPSIAVQSKITAVLYSIDQQIVNNNRINKNLEEQLATLFAHKFKDNISKATTSTCPKLGDLITIIDNRGKTPPLTTNTFEYPIIDVGSLKGSCRIIDFNNCTKYVNKATYETWFRRGHPKPGDILISTVGSLGEIKIYLGTKGCIAQNVIALRAITISPLYLYQYLRFIRADLFAYNIGSVQPSIKVTHIIKHPIFIPKADDLIEFEKISSYITNQLYTNYIENDALKEIRDTLLPKLMSGEIDVSKIVI